MTEIKTVKLNIINEVYYYILCKLLIIHCLKLIINILYFLCLKLSSSINFSLSQIEKNEYFLKTTSLNKSFLRKIITFFF